MQRHLGGLHRDSGHSSSVLSQINGLNERRPASNGRMSLRELWVSRSGSHARLSTGRESLCAITATDLFTSSGVCEQLEALVAAEGDGDAPLEDVKAELRWAHGVEPGRISGWRVADKDYPGGLVIVHALAIGAFEEASAELQALQSRHRIILDAAGEGIYGLDADGRVTFGNAAAADIVGWRNEDIFGRSAHEVHHHSHEDGSPYPAHECPIYAALRDGEVHRVEDEVFWHANGSPVHVEYTSTPILNNGVPDGAVVIFRDVSRRKELERQREKAFEEIAALTEQLEQERDYLRDEINITQNFGEIVGQSRALKRTLAQIEAVAPTPANVLILGESGVGKEMIARAIHSQSDRARRPLVKVNCASIPRDLFESDFFGHVQGAFTGAHRDRVGRLQLADGGTLFLDEVGEIPLALQSKLLRALQEHEFERVGDDRTVKVDVRVVAATNRNLEDEVRKGRFREDLYYRLSVFPVEVPPLRERSDDIGPLAMHFLESICREFGREPLQMTRSQLQRLKARNWPGNIRELRNVIERAIISSSGSRLQLEAVLPAAGTTNVQPSADKPESHEFLTDAEFRELEKTNLVAALRQSNGQVWGDGGAADLLGVKPSTLRCRMRAFGITRED